MRPALAGAVLAGGRASRFGSDKTRLMVEGLSLSSRLLAAQAQAGLGPLFLCAGSAPDDLPAGVRLLPDPVAGRGPLGALGGLLAAVDRAVLVAGGDMPGLDAAAFAALAAAYDGGPGLVSRDARGLQPLLAVYHPSLRAGLDARLAAGQGSLRDWVREAGLPAWDLPDEQWAFNINRPEDWAQWERRRHL